ncbi:CBL-interacting protein kinase 9 [Porphyridium purpureum]|uniref:non-specific serine/threonine protein kinase n=1 Tax=Porphyridium purpureum TaxID=35688 RepID=A0A5J4Z2P3_PORPP|nr:CBL-interacting protein kinase 9 [Porphyridium purpureum]|eukprot:POR2886..scf295_1
MSLSSSSSSQSSSHGTRVGKYSIRGLLGRGYHSECRLAVHEDTQQKFAVKIMDKKQLKVFERQLKREIKVMQYLNHPNIVSMRQVLMSDVKIYLVMEYVSGGELFGRIVKSNGVPEVEARAIFCQLVDAVAYCHSKAVYHRDLKPENLLLDENGTLKVTDFGMSWFMENTGLWEKEEILLYTRCGTPEYMAPEMWSANPGATGYRGDKLDAWSCGIILFALLTGGLPFTTSVSYESEFDPLMCSPPKISQLICHEEVLFPSHVSEAARDLISGLLEKRPEKRVTVIQIRQHPWLLGQSKLDAAMPIPIVSSDHFIHRNALVNGAPELFDEAPSILLKAGSLDSTMHMKTQEARFEEFKRSGRMPVSEVRTQSNSIETRSLTGAGVTVAMSAAVTDSSRAAGTSSHSDHSSPHAAGDATTSAAMEESQSGVIPSSEPSRAADHDDLRTDTSSENSRIIFGITSGSYAGRSGAGPPGKERPPAVSAPQSRSDLEVSLSIDDQSTGTCATVDMDSFEAKRQGLDVFRFRSLSRHRPPKPSPSALSLSKLDGEDASAERETESIPSPNRFNDETCHGAGSLSGRGSKVIRRGTDLLVSKFHAGTQRMGNMHSSPRHEVLSEKAGSPGDLPALSPRNARHGVLSPRSLLGTRAFSGKAKKRADRDHHSDDNRQHATLSPPNSIGNSVARAFNATSRTLSGSGSNSHTPESLVRPWDNSVNEASSTE